MSQDHQPVGGCCAEFSLLTDLSRRRFLGAMAATGAAAVTTSVFGDAVMQASYGATTGGNVLLVMSLRGGVDGMGMVVPHGDPAYAPARPTTAVPTAPLLKKDALFGLHPGLAPLMWAWDSGEMAAVQAVGLEVPNRSHFLATEEVEDADPTSSVRRGWVNRMIGLNTSPEPLHAINLGSSNPPGMLVGPSPSVSASDLAAISMVGAESTDVWSTRRRRALDTAWSDTGGPLGDAYRSAATTVDTLAPVGRSTYTPSVTYPSNWPAGDLSRALKEVAKLVKADVGTQVVSIDFGDWDMHDGYGTLDWGRMMTLVTAFASAMSAFLQDLGPLRSKVTVATMSEFGRRLKENGNRGLDHGWGNMMLLMGAGVRGGRYHGTWPGLAQPAGADPDLHVTTDYRQVLGEIVHHRFPDKSVSQVFPGLVYDPIGVMGTT